MIRILLSCCCILLFLSSVEGQIRTKKPINRRFNAGLIAGGSLTQIDGDKYQGFDNSGIYTGVKGIVNINRRILLNLEFLYSQRGSQFGPDVAGFGSNPNTKIQLNYVETPFLLHYRFVDDESALFLEGGMSFSRLISFHITEPNDPEGKFVSYKKLSNEFRDDEVNLIFGIGYEFPLRIGLSLRYSVAATKFYVNGEYNPSDKSDPQLKLMRNYYISALLTYRIFKLNKK